MVAVLPSWVSCLPVGSAAGGRYAGGSGEGAGLLFSCSVNTLQDTQQAHTQHTYRLPACTHTGCGHTYSIHTAHVLAARAHVVPLATASLCVMFFTLVCYLLRIDCGPVQAFVVLVVSRLRGTSTQPYFQELPDLST